LGEGFLVARKRQVRVTAGPLPFFGEVFIKSGWCRGHELEKNHEDCRFESYSNMTNKVYICDCECHKGRKRLIKEKP